MTAGRTCSNETSASCLLTIHQRPPSSSIAQRCRISGENPFAAAVHGYVVASWSRPGITPGKNVKQKSGLNRSISQEAWGRTVTMLTYKTARCGSTLVKVPAPNTSRRCSACGFITPGSREDQPTFVCKNPDCRWEGSADHNAARNILHLYRMGHALIPAAGRAVARRTRGVKPTTAR